ncbi:MAG: tyrosine-type recombinase/integrase [Candidatus Bathyarchaeia archaeon]
MNKQVNLEEKPLQRWLNTITRESTKNVYITAYRLYSQYTGKTATELIEEATEDASLPPLERQDIVTQRLIGFYKYLTTEHPVRNGNTIKKGASNISAITYVAAIRSFYATFGFTVRMRGRMALPRPQVQNKRRILNAEEVKMLVDCARTPRDRAIILVMFQSGMDVSTLCSLTYGQVAEKLMNNEYPLKLELYRRKRGIEYYTFLGRDAITALKSYIRDMENLGVTFTNNSPLFLKEKGKTALTENLIQIMMREVAYKAGFIDGNNNGNRINPVSPHALRESFGSIMINSGVPDTIVDFWLGHEIGDMARAYKGIQYENVRKMYMEREHLISISQPQDIGKLREAITQEVKREAQEWYGNVLEENIKLRYKVDELSSKLSAFEERFRRYEKFTQMFMEMTPDELDEFAQLYIKKREEERQLIVREARRGGLFPTL